MIKESVHRHFAEAERKAVTDYLDGGKPTLLDEYTEIESGKRNDRPELEQGAGGLQEAQGGAGHCQTGSAQPQPRVHCDHEAAHLSALLPTRRTSHLQIVHLRPN
jgi:hypothetical protein